MTRFGLAVVVLLAAGPAVAQPSVPEGLPAFNEFASYPTCRNSVPDLIPVPGNTSVLQPYANHPEVYGGIYLAAEQHFAPLAKYFFPRLQVLEDQKNWVRITRATRNGAKPPDHLTIFGANHNLRGEAGPVPVIMKIDKCTGAVLEMSFDKDKLR
jgi:hypothetical protein